MGTFKQLFAGDSPSGGRISIFHKNKKLFLALFGTLLLAAAIIGTVAGVNSSRQKSSLKTTAAHAILKSSCSSTLYPELCFSAIAAVPEAVGKISSQKDVIEASLNLTTEAVHHNYFSVKKLLAKRGASLTKREKTALHDKADKQVRAALQGRQVHVEKMCSNALAMIKNMTDTDMEIERRTTNRKLKEESFGATDESGWPEWLSAGDRRLLQSTTVTPNVVVAADGSGNYKTVAAAVAAAPEQSSKRYVIRIKAGVYKENVEVPKKKTNIMFLGDGRTKTIITGSRSVGGGSTTFNSATVAVVGERFLARDITFQNTAGASNHQAVALRVGADLSAFYQCDFLAYQDTLYVHSNRQFFVKCLIAGTVDFIFGNSGVVFQDCDIHARRPNSGQKNMLTAQGRTDPNQNTGIVIQKCRIGATSDLQPVKSSFPTYLGRPWKEYSRTVIMQSTISDVINPAGWFEWSGTFALNTLTYREYLNTGAGAGTSKRVTWKGYKVITSASEAQGYTAGNFIAGSSWLSSTGFPFSLGL